MQEQFKKSFCGPPAFNDPCGSTRCVDIYRAGPDGAWPASNDDDDDDDGAWPRVDRQLVRMGYRLLVSCKDGL